MNYRLIRSTKSASGRYGVLLPLFILGVMAVFHLFFPEVLTSAAAYVARPLWKLEGAVQAGVKEAVGFFSSRDFLAGEVARLRDELQQKDIQLLDRDALAEEHRLLKESFGRGAPGKGILAAVLTVPPRSLYDTIVLDAGSSEGVTEGALVYVGPVALGTVLRVSPHTSVAELYSTAGKRTPMLIQHAGVAVPVDALGTGGGAFTVTLPKEAGISAGDSVFMAGQGPVLFGAVDSVDATLTGSFQTLYIASPVNIHSLRFVEITSAP